MRRYYKMNATRKKRGVTLTELLVTMAAMGLLAGIGVSAVKGVMAAFESSDRIRDVIGAALSSARANAIKHGTYAGLRFQQDTNGDQYMIFIVQDDEVGPWIAGNRGFRAVVGRNPIRLPRGGGLMDLRIKTAYTPSTQANPSYDTETPVEVIGDGPASNANIDEDKELLDVMTFSVIFSSSGKVVLHTLKVAHDTAVGGGGDIFNTLIKVRDNGVGMFIEDENPDRVSGIPSVEGLQIESSRNRFIIFNKSEFAKQPVDGRWTGYLQSLNELCVNPYSGRLIGQ